MMTAIIGWFGLALITGVIAGKFLAAVDRARERMIAKYLERIEPGSTQCPTCFHVRHHHEIGLIFEAAPHPCIEGNSLPCPISTARARA